MHETSTSDMAPIITLDGPSGVGKGTLAVRLSKHLGWHYLDSGALYRVLAWLAYERDVPIDPSQLLALVDDVTVHFQIDDDGKHYTTWVDDQRVDEAIRTERCGQAASQLAALPEVRAALQAMQRSFARMPGLVADGRDMGTVIFPQAQHKFFLDASCEVRAKRRYTQLQKAGQAPDFDALCARLKARDERDRHRAASPLRPAEDAISIDTTTLTVEDVFQQIVAVLG